MELLIIIAVIWGVYAFIKAIVSNSSGDASLERLNEFELRIRPEKLGETGNKLDARVVEARGLFPVQSRGTCGFVTSLFDDGCTIKEGGMKPVISALDEFTEKESVCFQSRRQGLELRPGYGFSKWVQIGVILPEFIIPPKGGIRTITVVVRIVNSIEKLSISAGFSEPDDPNVLWTGQTSFKHSFSAKGYLEAAEHRERAQILTAQLAICVAAADGKADEQEAQVVRSWVKKTLSMLDQEERKDKALEFNKAMNSAHRKAISGEVSTDAMIREVAEIADHAEKYDALELCHEVMAADGRMDKAEIALLDRLIRGFDLDPARVQAIRDRTISNISAEDESEGGYEHVLGIDSTWSDTEIKQHLRKLFAKWNSRLNSLPEGQRRENAQRMLDMIARARKDYD